MHVVKDNASVTRMSEGSEGKNTTGDDITNAVVSPLLLGWGALNWQR